MKRFLSVAALAVAAALLGGPMFGSAQIPSSWPTLMGNASRQGFTGAPGPMAVPVVSAQWQLGKAVNSAPAVDASGVAYVGDDDGNVYALSPANPGTPLWSFKTGGPVRSSPTLSADAKTVFVGSDDGTVYALDAAKGTQRWHYSLSAPVESSPTLSLDGTTLYVSDVNGNLTALKAADGTSLLKKPYYEAPIPGSMALSPDGGYLYVATASAYVRIFNAGYGTPLQTTSEVGPDYLDYAATGTPAVDAYDNVYVPVRGELEAFQGGSSTKLWTFPTLANRTLLLTSPAVANLLVYTGGSDQNLYALDRGTGTVKWTGHVGGAITAPPVVGGNGLVYAASQDHNVYAFDAATGAAAWSLDVGAAVQAGMALGPGSALWVATQNGAVLRLAPTAATSTPTPTTPPTSPPVATRAPTSTSPPAASPTIAPTATPTPPPPQVILQNVRLQRNHKANFQSAASVHRVRAGTRLTVGIYVDVTQLTAPARLDFSWAVRYRGHVVAQHTKHLDLVPSQVGRHWSHWEYMFRSAGTYGITGAVSTGDSSVSGSVSLRVTR